MKIHDTHTQLNQGYGWGMAQDFATMPSNHPGMNGAPHQNGGYMNHNTIWSQGGMLKLC